MNTLLCHGLWSYGLIASLMIWLAFDLWSCVLAFGWHRGKSWGASGFTPAPFILFCLLPLSLTRSFLRIEVGSLLLLGFGIHLLLYWIIPVLDGKFLCKHKPPPEELTPTGAAAVIPGQRLLYKDGSYE